MVERVTELRSDPEYVAISSAVTDLVEGFRAMTPTVCYRAVHDLLLDTVPVLRDVRGHALHTLLYDHSLDEVAGARGGEPQWQEVRPMLSDSSWLAMGRTPLKLGEIRLGYARSTSRDATRSTSWTC